MRSAPAPDLLPIPGMNQGTAVAAGSGGSGDGDGTAGDGNDKEGAGGGKGGNDASGDKRNAPDYKKYPTCGTESHPVDVVTGRVFTHPITDLVLPGPLTFSFERSYSSTACRETQGLGYGWGHSLGWFVEVERRRVRVWNEKGVSVSFDVPQIGHSVLGDWGWVLRRELWGFAVDANDEVWRIFSTSFDEGKTFRLTAIEDRNKNRIALTYDDGKLVEVKDSVGRIIKVTSTKEGQITSLQVKNAEHQGQWIRFARYEYDDKGRLVRVTDADGHAWTYAYDEHNRLVRDTDRTGLSFCFRYDEKDRGVEAWGEYIGKTDPSLASDVPKFLGDGRTRAKGVYHRKFDYHKDGYTEVTDTTETRRYYGNKKGMLDKAVTGRAVTSSRYDAHGFEIEKTDAVGATWAWTRDERGHVLEGVDPLGGRTRYERDAYGLPVRLIDPAGGVTTAQRDQRGNIEIVTDPLGGTTQFTVDERGLSTSMTDANGATTRYVHDAQGNPVDVVRPNGGHWIYTYDALGRMLSRKDPTGAETRYAYSDRGDLVAEYDAAGGVTRYSYDGEGHLTQVVSPQGHTTHQYWGGYHKLCGRRDANGHLTRLAYSREGELVAVYNERDEVHRLFYDRAGRLVGEETFDGRKLTYRNDAVGRPARITNGAGETIDFTYDLAGQLVARELGDASEAYEYDARGDLVSAKNGAGELRFERDALGRVVREVQKLRGEEHWVAVAYDRAGGRVGSNTSLGHTERVERDAMGARVRTLLDGHHKVDHVSDLLAREVQRRLPRGGIIESAFDPMGRLAQRAVRSPVAALSRGPGEPEWLGRRDDGVTSLTTYQYSADGELVSKASETSGVTRYEHDPVGQLLSALPEKARAEVFRYDPTGNIFDAAPGAPEREYGKGNRLTRKGKTHYLWDDDGRLLEKRTLSDDGKNDAVWQYSWDPQGLLASAVLAPSGANDGLSVEFSYDNFARRLEKRVVRQSAGTTHLVRRVRFVWEGNALAHEIRQEFGSAEDTVVEVRTYWFDQTGLQPIAHSDTRLSEDPTRRDTWVHYANDPVGAPEQLISEDGTVLDELDRRAWGRPDSPPHMATSTSLRYQGQYEDEETGLAYNRFRYYDLEGTYISRDPRRLAGGFNAFAYPNSPLRWADPLGLVKTGVGTYSGGGTGGHHIHAQAAMRTDDNYSKYSAICISDAEMKARGINHQAITNKQRECYKALEKTGKPPTMADHDRIAKEALIAGKADPLYAQALVDASKAQLASSNPPVTKTRIPWAKP